MAVRRFIDDVRGGAAIEFALISPLLIFLIFATIEMAVMAMMSAGLDNAVATTARMIRTGQDDGPASAADFEALICRNLVSDNAGCRDKLQVSVQRFSRFAEAAASADAPPDGAFNKGVAGDIILVRATYRWPMIVPNFTLSGGAPRPGEVMLDARTVFKNEPYE
ncbi:conserved hypothetical protein [Phenylobacterium zucineum HLK1]|uniref:TadE-like domain-containing protein n=1 Tax=Phenylobacterium zucineum (strain HLK1) TaxID=450851 RepID=B4RAX1_PHEZH|nr:TadE/TadG family type IV pilus assembly protein [Phenylobacterium zucineum]ACG78022.1 conserved hypothetical protein [Phenylobacterium zucineum HLK1]